MSEQMVEALRSRFTILNSWRRVVLFISVGVVGAGVDTGTLVAVVEFTPLTLLPAKVPAWTAGIIVIFLLNEHWTFADYGSGSRSALLERLRRSFLVRFGGLCVAMGVLYALHYGLGVLYPLANVIGIGCGFFVNYTFETLFTWRVQHD